jgi:hypothetical protein
MRQEVAGTAAEADAHLTLTERVAAARAALAESHGNDDCTPVPADKQGAGRRLAPGLPDAKPLAAGDVPATLKRC